MSAHEGKTNASSCQVSPESARSLVPALERAMRILDLLSESPQRSFTVSEIARALGIPKSTAFNICSVMTEGQMMRRNGQGFQLGRKLIQLGSSYANSVDLVREFYDACRIIPIDLKAIIQLAIVDEHLDTVFLAQQDCNSGLRLGLGGGVGRRMPTNCTACGKALLSLLPPDELARHYAGVKTLPAMTKNSITSPAKLLRTVAAARQNQHLATDDEETIAGLRCIARAFPTSHVDSGKVAVSISAPSHGLTEQRQTLLRKTLDQLVETLGSRL